MIYCSSAPTRFVVLKLEDSQFDATSSSSSSSSSVLHQLIEYINRYWSASGNQKCSVMFSTPAPSCRTPSDGRRETQLGTFGCVGYWLLIMFEDLWHLCVPLQIFCLSSFSGNKNSRSFILRSLNSDGNIVMNLIFPSWPERLWNPPSGQQSRWVHLGPAWLPPGRKVSTCTFVSSHLCT